VLDEFVPFVSVVQQVLKLDRLGYRYRFTVYPAEDHVALAVQGRFSDSLDHMLTEPRQGDPGHISFSWYPQLERPQLGLGPQRLWWISGLRAAPQIASRRGEVATVEARSFARPDKKYCTRRRGGLVLNFKPMPGVYTEQRWRASRGPDVRPQMTLDLTGVAALTVDLARAGLATVPDATITVTTDGPAEIALEGVPPSTAVQFDDEPVIGTVMVSEGRHRISLAGRPDD
jgi:hypothetical protein